MSEKMAVAGRLEQKMAQVGHILIDQATATTQAAEAGNVRGMREFNRGLRGELMEVLDLCDSLLDKMEDE